jgi:hypothetical protein
MSGKRMSLAQMQALVEEWNTRYPVGTPVIVDEDNGTTSKTATRSDARILGGHSAVVWLDDRPGCFMLERITPR